MIPDYFDIHSHLNFKDYDADREEVITTLEQNNIWTITIGTDIVTSKEAIALADKHPHLFASIGLHPADDHTHFDENAFLELVTNKKVVAIGECGLDYFHIKDETAQKKQKELFEQQIAFAVKYDLPLMIHCRDAYPDCLAILSSKKKEYGDKLRGNFHFFTSPIETAQQCLELGFTLSFTGPITFASEYEDLVRYVPLEKMMAETDAPFAAPKPYRGKRNSPLYVKEIVQKIAEIKGQNLDNVRKKLVENSIYLFLRNSLS